MKTFVIQSKVGWNGCSIPAQAYGYTAIEAAEYQNWRQQERAYDYVLNSDLSFTNIGKAGAPEAIDYNYLNKNHIPIGSVEYVLAWLKKMGAEEPRPLNVPSKLRKYMSRECAEVSCLTELSGEWMVKDALKIKNKINGYAKLPYALEGDFFATRWVDDVISEWRLFVFNKRIVGLQCYSGNEWALPDKAYCERIADSYEKKAYTLDVMTYPNSKDLIRIDNIGYWAHKPIITDIVEAHDFFACGLYGFEDSKVLPLMWASAITGLLSEAGGGTHDH